MGLESVLLAGLGLVRVPGVRIHGGDHPVRCDLPGDTPPPVGAVRILGRFHVLPGDQCQQRIRIGRPALQRLGIDGGQQRQRIGDQRRNQPIPGILVTPRDVRFSRTRVVIPVSVGGQQFLPAGTSWPKRRIPAISCVMVSCLATASSRTVESTPRRRLPFRMPVSTTTSAIASMIRCGFPDPARRRRQYVSVLGWNAVSVSPCPHAAFQRRSYVNASAVSRSESPCNACNTSTGPITGAGTDGRPRRDGKRSSIIESGNRRPRCLARKAEGAARSQQLSGQRLHIQIPALRVLASLHKTSH